MIAKAPEKRTLTTRNPDHKLIVGGNYVLFGNVASPPIYWDYELKKKVSGTDSMCRKL